MLLHNIPSLRAAREKKSPAESAAADPRTLARIGPSKLGDLLHPLPSCLCRRASMGNFLLFFPRVKARRYKKSNERGVGMYYPGVRFPMMDDPAIHAELGGKYG